MSTRVLTNQYISLMQIISKILQQDLSLINYLKLIWSLIILKIYLFKKFIT